MEYLNELYSLEPKIDTELGLAIIHNTNDVTVYEGNSVISVCTKTYTYDISKTEFKIINIASDKNKVYLLCEHEEDLKYKTFVMVFKNKKINLFGIDSNKASHTNNKSFSAIDDIVYLINDENYFIAINTLSTDNTLDHDVLSYPRVGKYIANINCYIKLENNSYCNKMIHYSSCIYVPVLNSKKYIKYDINNNITSDGEFDINFAITKIDSLVQLGEKNKYSESGAVTLFTIDNKLVLMDMLDLVGNVINIFDSNIRLFQDDLNVFITCKNNLYKVDKKSFSISKVFFNNDIEDKIICILNKNIGFFKDSYFEELYKVDEKDTCIININSIDENGDSIQNRNHLIKLNETVILKANDIKGYTVFGKKEITLNATEKYYTEEFRYVHSVALYYLNVTHQCSNIELASYSLTGVSGEEYNIKPLNIPGYLYESSINNKGVFNENMNTECTINYIADSSFTTDSNHKVYVCCNCYCNGALIMKKYIPTTKGKNVLITSPNIPCFTPKESETIIPIIDYNIINLNLEYTKTEDNVYTEYIYNGHIVYKTVSPVKDDTAYLNPAPYINIDKYEIKLYGRDTLKIQCNLNTDVSILEAINYKNNEIIHRIIEVGKKETNIAPTFKKYKSAGDNIYKDLLLTVNQFFYEQTEYSLFIKHILGNKILKEEEIKGSLGSLYKINPIDDNSIETLSNLEYNFGPTDKEIKIIYETRKLSLRYKIINIENDTIVGSNLIRAEENKDITFNVPIPPEYKIAYQDTLVNQDLTISINKNIEYLYLVYKDKFPNCTKYERSGEGIKFCTNQKYKNLITVIVKDNKIIKNNKDIYVLKSTKHSNFSTLKLLKDSNINFKEIRCCDILEIPKHSVVIDGDIESKIKFLSNYNRPDVTYLPLDRNYNDFTSTVKFSLYDSTYSLDNTIKKITVEDEISIGNMHYNKNNHRLYINVNHSNATKNIENYTIKVYETNTLTTIYEEDLKINTIGNFNKAMVTINDSLISEPSKICDIDNISYNNIYKLKIIDEVIHCYLTDEIGNKTKTIHEPIIFNITFEKTSNNYIKERYKHNLTKYNHRFRGPRESYKFYNSYAGAKKTLNEMNTVLNDIVKNIKYKDNFIIDKE